MICLGANEVCQSGRTGPTNIHYAKGEPLYSQGDRADCWFEVVSGVVRTCHFHADGRRHLTGFFYSGDVFGVEGSVYQESAEAVTAVAVRRHARVGALASTAAEPHERALRQALRSAQECIFLLGHRTAAERIAAFLVSMMDRGPSSVCLAVPMSRSDIADHLGLTMHTVSRTISDFARKGLIEFDTPHDVRILAAQRLRELAGDSPEDLADSRHAVPSKREGDFRVA